MSRYRPAPDLLATMSPDHAAMLPAEMSAATTARLLELMTAAHGRKVITAMYAQHGDTQPRTPRRAYGPRGVVPDPNADEGGISIEQPTRPPTRPRSPNGRGEHAPLPEASNGSGARVRRREPRRASTENKSTPSPDINPRTKTPDYPDSKAISKKRDSGREPLGRTLTGPDTGR